MGAPGQTQGAPVAAMVKSAIVNLLILPFHLQRWAAAVVRAVWPGFRSA